MIFKQNLSEFPCVLFMYWPCIYKKPCMLTIDRAKEIAEKELDEAADSVVINEIYKEDDDTYTININNAQSIVDHIKWWLGKESISKYFCIGYVSDNNKQCVLIGPNQDQIVEDMSVFNAAHPIGDHTQLFTHIFTKVSEFTIDMPPIGSMFKFAFMDSNDQHMDRVVMEIPVAPQLVECAIDLLKSADDHKCDGDDDHTV